MKIALDVDDVIAAFTPHAFEYLGKTLPDKIDYWSVEEMDRQLGKGWFHDILEHEEEFWTSLPALSDPKDIDFKVYCYMSAFPTKMFHTRYEWIKAQGFPDAPLILTMDKVNTCEHLGIDILVDDKPDTIRKLENSDTVGVHFITPYAGFEPEGIHITNLKEIQILLGEEIYE